MTHNLPLFFFRSKMFGKGWGHPASPHLSILQNCVINEFLEYGFLRYSYSQRASFLLNCRSSSLVQISTNLAYPSSISLLVSFCYLYSQRASFPLNCRSSLLVQISMNLAYSGSISILVSFCNSYSQRASFPPSCLSTLPVPEVQE